MKILTDCLCLSIMNVQHTHSQQCLQFYIYTQTHTIHGRDHLLSSVNPGQVVVFTSLLRILTIMPITRVQGQDRHKNCPRMTAAKC